MFFSSWKFLSVDKFSASWKVEILVIYFALNPPRNEFIFSIPYARDKEGRGVVVAVTTDMGISIFVESDHNFGALPDYLFSCSFVSSYLWRLMDFSYGFNYP